MISSVQTRARLRPILSPKWPNSDRADRAGEERHPERRERRDGPHRGAGARKEDLGKHQGGGSAVDEEVVVLDRGSDQAGGADLAETTAFLGGLLIAGQCWALLMHVSLQRWTDLTMVLPQLWFTPQDPARSGIRATRRRREVRTVSSLELRAGQRGVAGIGPCQPAHCSALEPSARKTGTRGGQQLSRPVAVTIGERRHDRRSRPPGSRSTPRPGRRRPVQRAVPASLQGADQDARQGVVGQSDDAP